MRVSLTSTVSSLPASGTTPPSSPPPPASCSSCPPPSCSSCPPASSLLSFVSSSPHAAPSTSTASATRGILSLPSAIRTSELSAPPTLNLARSQRGCVAEPRLYHY